MRVAWIGLGHMGLPMAANLVRAGHTVQVFDVRPDAATPVVELGATAAPSVAAAVADADAIGVAVLDGAQVEAVTLGDGGALAAAPPDSVLMVHSTVHPSTVERVADAAPERVTVLDAPISGGVKGARAGTLCVMVGGPADAFERVRPALDAVGDLVLHLGPRGAGLAAKLARNLIGYVSMLGAQEGRALAAAAGTDPDAFAAILEHTGALSPMMRDLLAVPGGDPVYSANLEPLVELASKDLWVTLALGGDLDVELPATAVTLEHVAFAFGGPRPADP